MQNKGRTVAGAEAPAAGVGLTSRRRIAANGERTKMNIRIRNIFLAGSLLIGALSFRGTAQAVMFTGDTSSSSPTTIATYLTFSGASFNLDVPIGPGPTSLTDLGHFTLNVCSGANCEEPFGNQDGVADLTLRITFTDPIVSASSELFAADIFGTIFRSGNSSNIGNGSLLTIDFDNAVQHLTYSTALGTGVFDLSVNDPAPYTAASQFGNTRTVTGQISNLTFTESTPNGGTAAVPEPGSAVLMLFGLGGVMVSLRRKRFV
jgi:hypothetical protein